MGKSKEKYTLTFRLSGQPDPLNKMLRMHYNKRNRINKKWYEIVALSVKNKLPPKPLDKAEITAILYNTRNLDFDGSVGSLKSIVDGLVRAGVIRNDSYLVTGPWFVTQEHCKKGTEMVKITVREK